MEDPKKIKAKIAWLNATYKPAKWDAVEGYHSSMSVLMEPGGGQTINADKGITLKLFVNLETFEIKQFYYKEFIEE